MTISKKLVTIWWQFEVTIGEKFALALIYLVEHYSINPGTSVTRFFLRRRNDLASSWKTPLKSLSTSAQDFEKIHLHFVKFRNASKLAIINPNSRNSFSADFSISRQPSGTGEGALKPPGTACSFDVRSISYNSITWRKHKSSGPAEVALRISTSRSRLQQYNSEKSPLFSTTKISCCLRFFQTYP